MKYQETMDYSFLLGENHYIYKHIEEDDTLHLFVKSKPHKAKCPCCGMISRSLHATYERVLQANQFTANRLIFMQMFINIIVKIRIVIVRFLWRNCRLLKIHRFAQMP